MGLAVVLLLLGLLGLQGLSLGPAAPLALAAAGASPPVANFTTLNISNSLLASPGSHFWGVSVEGGNPDPDTPSLKGFLNATPFTVLRYGATWVDEENWSEGCFYNDTSVCYPVHNNVSDFAKLCESSARYYCILGVPAEINSVSTLAYEVDWLQSTTGWQPSCWSIGNEPQAWTHFGIHWTSWALKDKRTVTAAQFAQVALNYTRTLRSLDGPTSCIIGLESNFGWGSTTPPTPIMNIGSWTKAVTAAVPNDTAVSFHSYPDDKCTQATAAQILSPTNLTLTQTAYNAAANNSSGLPVYIQEFNLGSARAPSSCGPWVSGYTDSVFTSAVAVQALTSGDPQMTFFHFDCQTADCLVNSTSSVPSPTYGLYAGLLGQMDLQQLHRVNFTAGANPQVFAVLGENGTHDRTLLLSNAQPRAWLNLSESSFVPALPTDWEVQTITQNWTDGVTTSKVSSTPTTIAVHNQSTVLVHFWNSLPFSAPVSFAETGLPSGTTWSVKVSGEPVTTTTVSTLGGTTQSITLPDGAYSFTAESSNSSWAPPVPGSFFVDGTPLNVGVGYTLVTYPVQFTKTGLPDGQNWTVTFNGQTMNGTTSAEPDPLIFSVEPNGTYTYTIADVAGFHQTTIPYVGTETIDGAGLAVSVAFTPVAHGVTFSESGLPAGLTWSLTLNGGTLSLLTDGATDSLAWTGMANGTYPYTISDSPGWHETTLAYIGSVVVNGATVAESTLTYTPVEYPVAFSESGLPSGETFEVTVGGMPQTVTTDGALDGLQFTEPNGTYTYSISDIGGWHQTTLAYVGIIVVNGGAVSESLAYASVTYDPTFAETGLPSGRTWDVVFNGVPLSTTTNGGTDSLVFAPEPNGTYAYSVADVPGFHQTTIAYSGSETVTGGNGVWNLMYSEVGYGVNFSESGLPSGLLWGVSLNGRTSSLSTDGATDSLTFNVPNGTYSYSIMDVSGWHQTTLAYQGSLVVTAGAVVEPTLTFAELTYSVTFKESGLPSGTVWSVTLNGNTQVGPGASLAFVEPNGTYAYSLGTVTGYIPGHSSGSITVTGAAVKSTVSFKPATYTVTFKETGLPTGTSWSVRLGSTALSSTTALVKFVVPDGTYAYSVTGMPGYHITTGSYTGSMTVSGANPTTVTVHWTQVKYTVTFTETGLAKGTTWSVTIDGQTKSGTGQSISFSLPNGTYSFTITATGYSETSSPAGTLAANGAIVSVAATFART